MPRICLTFSYSARNDINDGKVGIPAGTGNYDVFRQRSENFGKLYLGRYQKIISPTLVNEFNASYSTRPLNNAIDDEALRKIQRDTIGFRLGQVYPANNPLNLIPNMSFGGVPNAAQISFDNRTPLTTTHEIVSITDSLTMTLACTRDQDRLLLRPALGGESGNVRRVQWRVQLRAQRQQSPRYRLRVWQRDSRRVQPVR